MSKFIKTECNPGQATSAPYTSPCVKVVRINGVRTVVEDVNRNVSETKKEKK